MVIKLLYVLDTWYEDNKDGIDICFPLKLEDVVLTARSQFVTQLSKFLSQQKNEQLSIFPTLIIFNDVKANYTKPSFYYKIIEDSKSKQEIQFVFLLDTNNQNVSSYPKGFRPSKEEKEAWKGSSELWWFRCWLVLFKPCSQTFIHC